MDSESSSLSGVPADILQQVFGKLPFPDLVRLRIVCRKWNTLICTLYLAEPPKHVPKCVPLHFLSDELTVYNSRVKAWQKLSLSFFKECIQTSRLELVASSGGLLCFETDTCGQLIVCNPISKIWKLLQVPKAAGTCFKASIIPAPLTPSTGSIVECPRAYYSGGYYHRPAAGLIIVRKRTTIVGLTIDPETGNHYKIIVASLSLHSGSVRATLVYDSRTSSWKNGTNVPDGEEFSDGDAIVCNGSLYCLVKKETFSGELFRYDVKNDEWSTLLLDMSVMRCKLVEHCGQVFMVKRNSHYSDESGFRFFHLREFNKFQGDATDPHDHDSKMSLEETDLIENLNLDSTSIIKVLGHLKSTGRGFILGQKNFLYVLKPPYEDGLKKKRTLVTIIDLTTGSCEVLHEMVVAAATTNNGDAVPVEYRMRNVFHLFCPSVTVRV